MTSGPTLHRNASPLARALALTAITLACAGTATTAAPPPPAGRPMTLIDEKLIAQPITLITLDSTKDELVFLDSAGEKQTRPLSTVLTLLPELAPPSAHGAPEGPEPSSWLELADAQRLPGKLAAPDKADDKNPAVTWAAVRLGPISIPLDLVSRYVGEPALLSSIASRPLSTANDTVVTMNLDRIEGVLEQLGTTITISPPLTRSKDESTTAPTSVPASQVALVNLFTKRSPATGPMLELVGGSVLSASDVRFERSALTFTARLAKGKAPPTRALASELVSFTPRAERFLPLASLPIAAQTPDASRVFGEPAQIDDDTTLPAPGGLRDIHLPGPMSIEWTLPPNASAAGASIELEPDALSWGDCNVVVSLVSGSNDRVLERFRLNADAPAHALKAELAKPTAGARLKITVEPGANGPVQDRVIIRRAMIVLGTPAK